jgi:hypothetical protein
MHSSQKVIFQIITKLRRTQLVNLKKITAILVLSLCMPKRLLNEDVGLINHRCGG